MTLASGKSRQRLMQGSRRPPGPAPTLSRSATQTLSRPAYALALAAIVAAFGVSRACARDDGVDTVRMMSIGGSCPNCQLSGRKLPGARFIGANLSGATLVAA